MKTGFYSLSFGLAMLAFVTRTPLAAEDKSSPVSALKLLLPAPQEMEIQTGHLTLGPSIRLSASEKWAEVVSRSRWLLDQVLESRKAGPVKMVKEPSAAAIRVLDKADATLPKNGYELKIGQRAIDLTAADSAGVFNGLATLAQLIEMCESDALEVPCCHIRDWPELALRAVHIDMTCQQYSAAYVQRLMRTLARYKVNAILMEYSGMFPFREHEAVRRPDAFSEEEIQAIRRTAEECHQEIIPFMQCAGHLEYVLTQDPIGIRLSEGHKGYSYCFSRNKGEVLPFIKSFIDEILAQHPGLRQLHIGGDEVTPGSWVDPDSCKLCASAGDFHQLYLKHYASIADYCLKKGVTPLIWTDIIAPFDLRDKPRELAAKIREAADILPKGIIGVDWWYQDTKFRSSPLLQEMGFQAITASAARSGGNERVDLPHFRMHMENIQAGCLHAVQSKLPGSIITSWSYRGVPHEICLPEYVCAAYGWNARETDVSALLKRFFRQRYGLSDAESAALAKSAFAETDKGMRIPTLESGRPHWDAAKRTWAIPSDTQAKQLIGMSRTLGMKRLQALLKSYLRQSLNDNALWQSVRRTAQRHQSELRCWELSRDHFQHRLELSLALIEMGSDAKGEDRIRALAEERSVSRNDWMEFYRDIFTPSHMKVELDIRFDVEPGIIEAVRRQWVKPAEKKKYPK